MFSALTGCCTLLPPSFSTCDCYLFLLTLYCTFAPLKRRPPPLPPPIPPGPGVFLELNEKRNLNCIPLKGMSGSAGWKLVINVLHIFYVSGSSVIIRTCLWCCAERRNSLGWGDSQGRRVGEEIGLHLQEGTGGEGGGCQGHIWHISGAIPVWFKMYYSHQATSYGSWENTKGQPRPVSLVTLLLEDGADAPHGDGAQGTKQANVVKRYKNTTAMLMYSHVTPSMLTSITSTKGSMLNRSPSPSRVWMTSRHFNKSLSDGP